jgi:uncharacterized cupredoxin-like copper-binding protein
MFTAVRHWAPILATLVLSAACGTSSSAAPANTGAVTPPPGAVHITLSDFSITPAKITVSHGTMTLYVTNEGKTPHNLTVRTPRGPLGSSSKVVAHSRDLTPGQADVLVTTLATGEYTIYCAFAGHEQLGMSGDLTVT